MLSSLSLIAVLAVVVIVIAAAAWAWRRKRDAPKGPSSQEGFSPQYQLNCGSIMDNDYGVDMSYRNAAGTVVWNPYSTQSRVSLERGADTPEVATPPNPVSGIGNTSTVRRLEDRYRRGKEMSGVSIYDLQPGEPGYMEAVGDDVATFVVSNRRPASTGAAPPCTPPTRDPQAEYVTDGYFGDAVLPAHPGATHGAVNLAEADVGTSARGLGGARAFNVAAARGMASRREGLTSTRAAPMNELTASRTGLGSTRRDPRFEPGPPWPVPGGDAQWARGTDAGGPTNGAFTPDVFAPPANFRTAYVYGFGDPNNLHGTRRHAEVVAEEAGMARQWAAPT